MVVRMNEFLYHGYIDAYDVRTRRDYIISTYPWPEMVLEVRLSASGQSRVSARWRDMNELNEFYGGV